jgi:zinc protease
VSGTIPSIHTDQLANGLQLQTVGMHDVPIVTVALNLRAGSSKETLAQAGLSYLAGSSLDAGTATTNIHGLAERIEFLGTSIHVNTMHDACSIIISTIPRHLDAAMEILGEIICTASFPDHEVNRLRETQLAVLVQMRDRPGVRASLVLDRVLFGTTHPYGRSITGVRNAVEHLTRTDVLTFFERCYTPAGSLAIAVGDVHPDHWLTACQTHLHAWQSRAVDMHPPAEVESSLPHSVFLVDRPATPQAEVRIGSLAMQRNHPDYVAATMLNHILGGQFSSRLNTSLRERRGLTYGAWSAFSALRSSGSFTMGGAFHTAQADEAVRVAIGEVSSLAADGVSAEEFEFARRSMTGAFLRSFETPSQVCSRLQSVYVFSLPAEYYREYLQQLDAVTPDDIVRIARQWLDPDRFAVVAVGDASTLRPRFEQLRIGEVVDYDDA